MMYGFYISNCPNQQGAAVLGEGKVRSFGGIQFMYHPMPKFERDKLFYEDEEKILLLDGVIFNQRELMSDVSGSWQSVVDGLYRYNPENFFSALRGSFCGAVLEKASLRLTVFTNHSGEKTVYYTVQNGIFIVASHNNILTEILRENHLPVQPDPAACRELIACGSILAGKTPFQQVRRVTAGKYVSICNGAAEETRYHIFRNVPEHTLSLDECIEELDKRFRKAVDRIFSKNKEYGYQGECDLSGGLDSRMVTWVAHDLGYHNILNVCYCQSGNLDHTVSKKIAKKLGNPYFFFPMDGGELLTDVDEVVGILGGQESYIVSTGANRAIQSICKKYPEIGLTAMGLWGEALKANCVIGDAHTPPDMKYRYSDIVPLELDDAVKQDYETYEQMCFYEYGAPFILSSMLVRQQLFEAMTPNADVEYLEFVYRLPVEYRKDGRLLCAWITKKYPEAAKFVWQTTQKPVDKSYNHQIYWPKVAGDVRKFCVRCINKAGRILHLPIQISQRTDMNPFDVWYRTNPALRKFVQSYYEEKLPLVKDADLRQILTETFTKGAARDKLQAVNLLAVYHRYFAR